jgi:hypothetical protein
MALLWREHGARSWVLNEEQKQEICRRYKAGVSMRKLTARYGLRSHSAIHSIVRTRTKGRRVSRTQDTA